jgi:hypothetical protein
MSGDRDERRGIFRKDLVEDESCAESLLTRLLFVGWVPLLVMLGEEGVEVPSSCTRVPFSTTDLWKTLGTNGRWRR